MLPPDNSSGGLTGFASPYYSADQHPQSPRPPNPDWRGVMIAAPPEAVLTARQPLLILRGCYRIAGTNYPANDRLKLIAVDIATRREYNGLAGQSDPSPDVPPPPSAPPDPETVRRMIFSGFFNADLMGTLKLPLAPATYRVRAEFGNLPSNELTIRVAVQ